MRLFKVFRIRQQNHIVSHESEISSKLFPINHRVLKALRIWPTKDRNDFIFERATLIFLTLFGIHIPMFLHAFKNRNDFVEASYGICESISMELFYARFASIVWNGKLYLEVIKDLENAWKKGMTINFETNLVRK